MFNGVNVDKLKSVVTRPIPDQLIQQRSGGGNKMLSYLSGSAIIDHLNEAFGYLWDWHIEKFWVQNSIDKFNPKYDKEPVPQGPVAHCHGVLTVYFPKHDGTFFAIKKSAAGAQMINGGQSDQEHIFKSCSTDALKKAASMLGIALELARSQDEQEFFYAINYEDPWTDEMLAKHAEDRNIIKSAMESNGLTQEDMNGLVQQWSNGALDSIDYLVPDNIVMFREYLQNLQKEQED